MKAAWTILLISAITDFIINAGTGIMTAMLATTVASIPNKAVVGVALLSGLIAMARTIQQALKMTPDTAAALRGDQSITATQTIAKTP